MTTFLEILDSAVKIGLGALISGIATYFVSKKNQEHELRKATRDDRRELIRTAARLLEEATALINQGTYGLQRGQSEATAGAKLLIDAINILGEAKSIAILLGEKTLSVKTTDLRAAVVELALYVGPDALGLDPHKIIILLTKMNESWPTIHTELEAAYAKVAGDA
jgi:hypothetical protein